MLVSSLSVQDPHPGATDLLTGPRVMGLADHFAVLTDPRDQRWVTHPLAVVLTLCACAVVAGMKSFTAIVGWVADTPLPLLHHLYDPCGKPAVAPSKTTIWQVLTNADATTVDAAVGAWLATQAGIDITVEAGQGPGPQPGTTHPAHCQRHPTDHHQQEQEQEQEEAAERDPPRGILAVDGKRVRGAVDADGNAPHLLAAATHQQGLVLAQIDVHHKTNEIPMFAPLLDTMNIAGMLITADCLHTQRKHACYLNSRGADFVFCVKDNQPKLFDALDALAWPTIAISHATTSRGHGRVETRTLQVIPAPPGLPFPHVNQVFLIERTVTDLHGTPLSNVAILGVTSLNAARGTPELIAEAVRGQWKIEALHWIRDAIYREDDSKAHTRSGPRIMAALRNLAIGALRLHGRNDIAEATRWAARNMERPFTILGLIP